MTTCTDHAKSNDLLFNCSKTKLQHNTIYVTERPVEFVDSTDVHCIENTHVLSNPHCSS